MTKFPNFQIFFVTFVSTSKPFIEKYESAKHSTFVQGRANFLTSKVSEKENRAKFSGLVDFNFEFFL